MKCNKVRLLTTFSFQKYYHYNANVLVQSVYERLLRNYKSLLLLVQCGPGVAVELEYASI